MKENLVEKVFGAAKDVAKAGLDAAYSPQAKELVAHGAHELASALFSGNAFVMYPRGSHDNGPEHGLGQQGQEPQGQEQSRGGRE